MNVLKKAAGFIKHNNTHIMTGFGIIGVFGITAISSINTLKARDILDIERDRRSSSKNCTDELSMKEVVKLTWKCYIPTAVMATFTLICIMGSNSSNTKQNAALASLYSLSSFAFDEYQEKVRETIGKNKEAKIHEEIVKDRVKANPPATQEVFITGKGDVLCQDLLTGRYFKSDIEKIRQGVNDFNRDLLTEMQLPLNHFYSIIGINEVEIGNIIGWDIENGQLDIRYTAVMAEDDTPCIAIEFMRCVTINQPR